MLESYATPRRFPRVKVLGNVSGELSLQHEHAGRFALNSICFLRLPARAGKIVLKARVVYSAVSRTASGTAMEPTLL